MRVLGAVLAWLHGGQVVDSSAQEATGEVMASAICVCERCSEEFELAVTAPVQLTYVPVVTQGTSGERELAETELDLGWYSDGRIAVSDIISEALALALPERTICLDVEGCDKRTAALLAAARMDAPTGHPGFAALKDL